MRGSVSTTATLNAVMAGADHVTVDPAAFVPLKRVQMVVKGRITRLKHMFSVPGFRAEPDITLVTKIAGSVQREIRWFSKEMYYGQ